MKTLIEKLTTETQELKIAYMEQVEKWANSQFDSVEKRATWSEAEWCKYLGIEAETRTAPYYMSPVTEIVGFPKGFYNTKNAKTYRNSLQFSQSLKANGKEKFIAKMVKAGEEHYTGSIIKLAYRINSKQLDENNITIKSSRVGINIEMVLTDGNKIVKAWTIVAQGEIQKPHYRYLVK